MFVKYIGPFEEVAVPALDLYALKGEVIEVGDEEGARLLEQVTNWELAEAPAKAASAAASPSKSSKDTAA